MKNILLLTDFSDNALNAIRYAMRFFEKETCIFHVLHVHKVSNYISDDLMYSNKESLYDVITKEPKEKLNNLVENLKKEFNNPKHTFKILIDFDVFTDAVNQTVESENIDLTIIGSNGATGAQEVVFGSNTLNLIRKVDCKALVIPEGHEYRFLNNLLLALEPRNSLTGNPFSDILQFIDRHNLHLHVLRVNPYHESTEYAESDTLLLSSIECIYHKIDDVPIDYAVSSYLQTNAIDIVSIFSRKENFFERFFKGSSTTKVSKAIHVPMLFYHQ